MPVIEVMVVVPDTENIAPKIGNTNAVADASVAYPNLKDPRVNPANEPSDGAFVTAPVLSSIVIP